MRILIAEDEIVSRRVLQRALEKWGYEVIVASDGIEAWSVLQCEQAPKLAILDIMMAEMTGIEVCRRIREIPGQISPYLILLTAKSGKEDLVRGLDAGANDFLKKPFNRSELHARIRVGLQMLALQHKLADRGLELQKALLEVRHLRGMLPICSYCKSIRDDQNYWQRVEIYISERADVEFSHGICPTCYDKKVLPQLAHMRLGKKQVE